MINKVLRKLSNSLIKLVLPILSKIFISLKVNRRVINFLSEKSYYANNISDFSNKISSLIKNEKLIALDVGAQGGFNSDNFFPEKYKHFFEPIMLEPIAGELEKIKDNYKYIINKGLWSSKAKKKLYILDKRLGSSSFYEPDKSLFPVHKIKKKYYNEYDVTKTIEVDCDTLTNELERLNINNLDYLKIDTQGSEFEILKGIGNYRPLLIRTEVHINSMYKNVPEWANVLSLFEKLNYIAIDLKSIGSHATRIPVEADMIFIPNFKSEEGKNLIKNNEEKFISILLIFGQIELLKVIARYIGFANSDFINEIEDKFFF